MDELVTAIRAARQIVLVSHLNPDGDAVGSLLGLHLALLTLGKGVDSVLRDGVPAVFASYLKGADTVAQDLPEDYELCVLLDANGGVRTGFQETVDAYAKAGRLAVIDHHPMAGLGRLATAYVHDIEASSTSELLVDVVRALEVRITPELATCLLTGLYTDTGGFQFSNTTPKALEAAAELLRRGGKLQAITRAFDREKSIAGLRLIGLALERAFTVHDITVSVLAHADFERLGASDGEIHGIIRQLQNIPGAQAALLLTEAEAGVVRGNLRSNDGSGFNVNILGRLLGGGGHAKASGFKLPGKLVEHEGRWQVEAP
jgi:phosphoesterase RecJ-like protein